MKKKPLLFVLLISISYLSCSQNKNASEGLYSHEVVVPNLAIPWGIAFLPDGSMLITEKEGKLLHYKNNAVRTIKGLPEIILLGQGGLMDVEVHPNYAENGWIYLSYASSEDSDGDTANTTIMRAKIENNTLTNKQILYKASPDSGKGQHFGSRIIFDNNNYLYFSVGDRGNRDVNPQDVTRDCGKIYRLHDDGSIPTDNPFIDSSNAKKGIFSYGHRNPQGLTKHPKTGVIWAHEHGPKGGDEINIIKMGKNYGWPLASFGINYSGSSFTEHTSLPGMQDPAHHWTPSIAPSGMCFISGNVYANWEDKLLVGSLKFQYLNLCTLQNNKVVKEERLLEGLGRVRSVKQGPDGYIYVGIENLGVVKIIPNK